MKRRKFFELAAMAATCMSTSACTSSVSAELTDDSLALSDALKRFRSLSGIPVYAISVESPENEQAFQIDHLSDRQIVIGSAFKTFIVAKCLQDIEESRLSFDQLIQINDLVRVNNSPVFIDLTGSVALHSVLDAILAYSDNTATDAAMAVVGAGRVRAFLGAAGLKSTRIPDSIRIFESYASGAPLNVDIGWEGIQKLLQGILVGTPPPLHNNQVSILSSADDLVSYYRRALHGDFFTQSRNLAEFKRLHSLGNIFHAELPETVIYGKVGNASWLDSNVLCFAGQMALANGSKITFAFADNWNGPAPENTDNFKLFDIAVRDVLAALKNLYARSSACH